MLTEPHIKERLSMAYVDAIAGRAGVNVTRALHDYGVDGTFHPIKKIPGGYTQSGFAVEFQLKATINGEIKDGSVVYDLEASAYNKMVSRDPREIPLVLLVMCLPSLETSWLRQNEKALLIQRSCYWFWEGNGPPTRNTSTIRISIPRTNLLDVNGLTGLLRSAEAYQRGTQDHV